MEYQILECFGGAQYAIVVTNMDDNNEVLDTREEAETEAADCHDGMVAET